MTHEERVEAALLALPNATPAPWKEFDGQVWTDEEDPWLLATIETTGPAPDADLALMAAAPDLAAEVIRLRAELAELKRWRDPVAEPPTEEDQIVIVPNGGKGKLRWWSNKHGWAGDVPTGWMPLPEVEE